MWDLAIVSHHHTWCPVTAGAKSRGGDPAVVSGHPTSAATHSSSLHASLQFLRILRSLPYGNSIFFPVKRIDDPIGLLPAKLILGVNKRGVHFFRWGGWRRVVRGGDPAGPGRAGTKLGWGAGFKENTPLRARVERDREHMALLVRTWAAVHPSLG